MPDMLEVVIDSVRVNLMTPQRVIVLRQVDADRYLPIWVGPYEADAISIALQEVEVSRPLTHDLLRSVFQTFKARLVRVEVTALKDDTFYSRIIAQTDGDEISIDSRPSDAMALAVRAHIPILVDPQVMETAGIVPEKDIQETTPENSLDEIPLSPTPPPAEGQDRLDVFKDFLDKIDPEAPPEDEPPKET